MPTQDYYQELGVSPQADAKQIRDAYRKLAFQFHPDRNRDTPAAAEKMKRINEAYAVLSDTDKRRQYDMLRSQFGNSAHEKFRQTFTDQDIFRGSDIHKVFEEMAKAYGIRGFDEIFRELNGRRRGPFRFGSTGGPGAGFGFNGRFGAVGQKGPLPTGPAARLIQFILRRVANIELPEDGADIRDSIKLSADLAKTGGPFAYFHRPHSKKLIVNIPPAVRQNQLIRLAGQGQAGKFGGRSGDLLLKVRIHKPLSARLKSLLARG